MKVIMVSHTAELGGAESCLVQAVQVMHAQGHVVRVVVPKVGPLVPVLQESGASVTIIPFRWWMHVDRMKRPLYYRVRRLALEVLAQVRFGLLVRHERPDIVISNTMTIVTGALAAKLGRVRHVWYVHEFGSKSHSWSFDYGARFSHWVMNRLSDFIVVNSRATRAHLSAHVPPQKLHVLYSPVNPPSSRGSRERDPAGPFRLVCVGSLIPGKRQEDAIRSIALLRAQGYDVQIAFYGRAYGTYGTFLRDLVSDLHLQDAVTFCGYSLTPWATSAHVSVTCSMDEAFGLTTVEAMMTGMPVIGAASGATPELIQDGWNGFLFSAGDAASLASKIAVLYHDQGLLRTMGANAQAWAEETFRRERYGHELLATFSSVLCTSPSNVQKFREPSV
jgi:glycosyltransferase involved in cell wall biosynthesis